MKYKKNRSNNKNKRSKSKNNNKKHISQGKEPLNEETTINASELKQVLEFIEQTRGEMDQLKNSNKKLKKRNELLAKAIIDINKQSKELVDSQLNAKKSRSRSLTRYNSKSKSKPLYRTEKSINKDYNLPNNKKTSVDVKFKNEHINKQISRSRSVSRSKTHKAKVLTVEDRINRLINKVNNLILRLN